MTQFQFLKPLPYIIWNEQRITNWTEVLEGDWCRNYNVAQN